LITHYLGKEEVAAYSRDLANRLANLGDNFPTKWFAVGLSGEKIAEVLYDSLISNDLKNKVELTTVYRDRKSEQIKFLDSVDDVTFDAQPVLLIDSAVHSGETMLKISKHLWTLGAQNIISYTLMLKRTSIFVPTYFGVLVADKDRVYFQLDEMPNNRLCESPPFGVLRELTENDIALTLPSIGPPFDHLNVGDLLYDKATKKYHPYVFELPEGIAGLVTFFKDKHALFIDAWATAERHRRKGIGPVLLRWSETWARSNKCNVIQLWAFEPAISVYKKYGYSEIPGRQMMLSPTQKYTLMGKTLLYNIRLAGDWP
jgi:GNAT superfamily N-acetyltransferase